VEQAADDRERQHAQSTGPEIGQFADCAYLRAAEGGVTERFTFQEVDAAAGDLLCCDRLHLRAQRQWRERPACELAEETVEQMRAEPAGSASDKDDAHGRSRPGLVREARFGYRMRAPIASAPAITPKER
jgi:hypothetical protein